MCLLKGVGLCVGGLTVSPFAVMLRQLLNYGMLLGSLGMFRARVRRGVCVHGQSTLLQLTVWRR